MNKIIIFIIFLVIHSTSCAAPLDIKINVNVEKNSANTGFQFPKYTKYNITQNPDEVIIAFNDEINPVFINLDQSASDYITDIHYDTTTKSIILSMTSKLFDITKTTADDGITIKIAQNNKHTDFKSQIIPLKNPIKTPPNSKNKDQTITQINTNIKGIIEPETFKEKKINLTKQILKTFSLALDISFQNDQTSQLNFKWDKDVAAAVFIRSNYLWIIFNEKSTINIQNIIDTYKNNIVSAEQIDNEQFTIIKLKFNQLTNVRAFKKDSNWIVELPPFGKSRAYNPAKIISQYNTPFSQGIFFPAESMAEPSLLLLDPEIGDTISVVTLYQGDCGVDIARNFVDFKLFKSAQGFAVSLISDNALLQIIKPGIEIIVPKDHFVTNKTDASLIESAFKNSSNDLPINIDNYTINSFIPMKNEDFSKEKKRIDLKNTVSTDQNKSKGFFNLANFYFANQMYREAVSAYKLALNDTYAASYNKNIMIKLGIANFMSFHNIEANQAFESINLNNLEKNELHEITLWKELTKIQITGNGNPIDIKNLTEGFLSKYPRDIQEAIIEKYIEFSIEIDDNLKNLLSLCKIFTSQSENLYFKNSLKYYTGLITKKIGDSDNALKIWKDLSQNFEDAFNSTRARFQYIVLLLDKKNIDNATAEDELENLLLRWRGDDVEAKILQKLGDLYYEDKNYTRALNIWKNLVGNLSSSGESLFITSKMSNAFVNLFISEVTSSQISDLQLIALFYQFKELLPIGKMGDTITSYVAQRMINLDLLSRAAMLLTHQVKYRLEGTEKLNAASKLALVYLMNRKPDMAIKTLDETEIPNMDYDLFQSRNQIKAEALMQQQKYDEALFLIRDNFTDSANNIKTTIFMQQNNWRDLKRILLVSFDGREANIKPFSKEEENNLLKLSFAFYMLEQQNEILNLLNRFDNLLEKDGITKQVLHFLATRPSGTIDTENFVKSIRFEELNNFIDKFKKSIIMPKVF